MIIFVDGVVFENSYQRGIQRYFIEILSRIGTKRDILIGLTAPAVSALPPGCRILGPTDPVLLHWHNLCGRMRRRLLVLEKHRKIASCDVFQSTYFTTPALGKPSVVTLHDMIPERFPDLFWNARDLIYRKRNALESASRIIAISQATADELTAFYPWCRDRVRIVHHGADHLPVHEPAQLDDLATAGGYVLFVGDRSGYKNFRVILDAMKHESWPSSLRLKIVGPNFSPVEQIEIASAGLESRVEHVGRVDDLTLAQLYNGAAMFVFPSLAEGFGFPLLEAQRCGCPVICSNIPVFHEVAGVAAEFVDPTNPKAWADRICDLIDPHRRAALVEAGFVNERRFRWDDTAARTVEVYMEAVQ